MRRFVVRLSGRPVNGLWRAECSRARGVASFSPCRGGAWQGWRTPAPLREKESTSTRVSVSLRRYTTETSGEGGTRGCASYFEGLIGLSAKDQETLEGVASDDGELRAALEVLFASGVLEREESGPVDWERRDALDQFGHSQMLRTFWYHKGELFSKGLPVVMAAAEEGVPGACFVAYLVTNAGVTATSTGHDAQGRGDPEKAVEWLKNAVKKEHGISMAHYARHFHQANREEGQDDTVAFIRWMEKARAAGVREATNALATATLHGYGVEKDFERAIALYKEAAGKGSALALAVAAHALADRDIDKFEPEIAQLLKESGEMGRAKSFVALGEFLSHRGKAEAAFDAFSAAHQGGELEGTLRTADALDHGGKGAEVNKAQAAQLYEKAAQVGHAHAQLRLGEMLMWADGLPRDNDAAKVWLSKAAEQGNDVARLRLVALQLGDQTAPDTK